MKFSIITPCLNSEKKILSLIKSVNEQSYRNIEHLFIDGNSNDQTKKIILNHSKYGVFINQSSSGIYSAMNEGISKSTGDILIFIGSDDFFSDENVLKNVVDKFSNYIDIVFGNINYYDFTKKKYHWRSFKPGKYFERAYLNGWHAPHPAFFIKKKSIKSLYDISQEISADFKFMFYHQEILKLNSFYLNKNLTTAGIGGTSQNFKNIITGNKNIVKTLKNYYKFNFLIILLRRFLFKLKSTL